MDATGASERVDYGGFWIRVAASIIDTLLLMLILVPALVAIYGWDYFDAEKTGIIAGPADLLLSYIAPAIAVVMFWIYRSATPGKMMLSLRIVDAATGNPPTTGQCIGRYLGYFVSMLPLGLGLVWVAFDKRKQGWHDKLAGTVVVRGPREPGS